MCRLYLVVVEMSDTVALVSSSMGSCWPLALTSRVVGFCELDLWTLKRVTSFTCSSCHSSVSYDAGGFVSSASL